MQGNMTLDGTSLGLRPATSADAPFLEQLYRSTRPELQALDAASGQAPSVAAQQYAVLQSGIGASFPDAMHFVVEQASGRIGSLVVDFGANEVRLIHLSLLPAVRGRGYGRQLLQGLQQAAARAHAPLAVTVWRSNPRARALYLSLGFAVEETHPVAERMVWYPPSRPMVAVP